jgi:hypothetical protein
MRDHWKKKIYQYPQINRLAPLSASTLICGINKMPTVRERGIAFDIYKQLNN